METNRQNRRKVIQMFPKGIVASIQPSWPEESERPRFIAAIARECAKLAVALRIEGIKNIKAVAREIEGIYNIPIIGLVKRRENALNTLITPTFEDACEIYDAGASYIAMELTDRLPITRTIECIDALLPIIADIADLKHAKLAQDIGCTAITTALSGYINQVTHPFALPDFKLVHQCHQELEIPVIAEGRYNTNFDISMAKDYGAYAVCIGTAIHEPKHIVHRAALHFNGLWEEHSKNGFIDLV